MLDALDDAADPKATRRDRRREAQQTMLGIRVESPTSSAPPRPAPVPSGPKTPVPRSGATPPEPLRAPRQPTLTGLPAQSPYEAPAAKPRQPTLTGLPAQSPYEAPAVKPRQPTLTGLPAQSPYETPVETPPQSAANPQSHRREERRRPRSAGATLMGLPAARAAEPGAASFSVSAAPSTDVPRTVLGMPAAESPASDVPRTVLGMPAATPPATPHDGVVRRTRSGDDTPTDSKASPFDYDDADFVAPRPKRLRLMWVLALGASVALVTAGIAVYIARQRAASIQARIVQTKGGEALQLELEDEPPGSKVKFAGQVSSLSNGKVSFKLDESSLRVGENHLVFEVQRPGGGTNVHSLTLVQAFRTRSRVVTLGQETQVEVTVDVLPGAKLSLGGQSVTPSASGRVLRVEPVREGTLDDGAEIVHRVAYRIDAPDGVVESGEIQTPVPLTALQLDRPGLSLVTDQKSVEIAGATDPAAVVRIGDERIKTKDGRFVHLYKMSKAGTYDVNVVASAPFKASRKASISIRRVRDLGVEASAFEADTTIEYAKLARDADAFRGKKAAFEGRVYNAAVTGGRSVLQILVKDCPKDDRCPLWVTYPSATEAKVDSWVRVLGTLSGMQQFRSESDRVVTVPSMEAQFVLPARP